MDRDDVVAPPPNTLHLDSGAGGETMNTRQVLGTLFARVLEVAEVGEKDNFFEMGGDSRAAAHLINTIRTELGSKLTVREFYKDATIAGVMKIIATPEARA